jgi:hypothetical protein
MVLDVLQIEREGAFVDLVGPGAERHIARLPALGRHERPLSLIIPLNKTCREHNGGKMGIKRV